MGTLANCDDPDEMCIFAKIKTIFRERNSILVGKYNL